GGQGDALPGAPRRALRHGDHVRGRGPGPGRHLRKDLDRPSMGLPRPFSGLNAAFSPRLVPILDLRLVDRCRTGFAGPILGPMWLTITGAGALVYISRPKDVPLSRRDPFSGTNRSNFRPGPFRTTSFQFRFRMGA